MCWYILYVFCKYFASVFCFPTKIYPNIFKIYKHILRHTKCQTAAGPRLARPKQCRTWCRSSRPAPCAPAPHLATTTYHVAPPARTPPPPGAGRLSQHIPTLAEGGAAGTALLPEHDEATREQPTTRRAHAAPPSTKPHEFVMSVTVA